MAVNNQTKRNYIILIFLIWHCCVLFVNPLGEFPLNDDWSYAKNVFHLSENGDIVFDDWPAMTLIAHMIWGAVFTSVFGFSFTVLRISVLILGFAGVVGFFLVLSRICKNNVLALIGSLTLALNPLYFSLSNTFMTDVSFLTMIIWSVFFFLSYLENPKLKTLIIATLFIVLATLIRQLGVWIAISFVIVNLIFFKSTGRKIYQISILSLIPLIILAIFPYWLNWVDTIPSHYSSVSDLFHPGTINWIAQNFMQRAGIVLFSIGLFSLPLSLFVFPFIWKKTDKIHRILGALLVSVATVPVILNLKHVPAGNVFHNLGLGPKILKDTYWGLNFRPVFSDGFQWFHNGLGIIGAVLLVFIFYNRLVNLFSKNQSIPNQKINVFFLTVFSGYLGFIMIGTHFFDRYFLTIFPFILLFILPEHWASNRKFTIAGLTALLPFLFFSTAATKDYLSWNRARWDGLNELMERGISPKKIDGGFEFNSWYSTGQSIPAQPGLKSWWWVADDEYAAAFGNICGYEEYKSYNYFSFLSMQTDSIIILKKIVVKDSVCINSELEEVNPTNDYFLSSDSSAFLSNAELRSNDYGRSGSYSIKLNKEFPYGLGILFENIALCEEWHISVWSKDAPPGARLVAVCPDAGSFYWDSKFDGKEENGWVQAEINFIVPDDFPSSSLKIFLRNLDAEPAYFDDIKIVRYKKTNANI